MELSGICWSVVVIVGSCVVWVSLKYWCNGLMLMIW